MPVKKDALTSSIMSAQFNLALTARSQCATQAAPHPVVEHFLEASLSIQAALPWEEVRKLTFSYQRATLGCYLRAWILIRITTVKLTLGSRLLQSMDSRLRSIKLLTKRTRQLFSMLLPKARRDQVMFLTPQLDSWVTTIS